MKPLLMALRFTLVLLLMAGILGPGAARADFFDDLKKAAEGAVETIKREVDKVTDKKNQGNTKFIGRKLISKGNLAAYVRDPNWCGPTVDLQVQSTNPAEFSGAKANLQRLLGAARNIVGFECPQARNYIVRGFTQGRQSYTGRYGVSTQWRLADDAPASGVATGGGNPAPATLPPPPTGRVAGQALSTAEIKDLQGRLRKLGYQADYPDGYYGSRTRQAIQAYQQDKGLPVDGQVSRALLNDLRGIKAERSVQVGSGVSMAPAYRYEGLTPPDYPSLLRLILANKPKPFDVGQSWQTYQSIEIGPIVIPKGPGLTSNIQNPKCKAMKDNWRNEFDRRRYVSEAKGVTNRLIAQASNWPKKNFFVINSLVNIGKYDVVKKGFPITSESSSSGILGYKYKQKIPLTVQRERMSKNKKTGWYEVKLCSLRIVQEDAAPPGVDPEDVKISDISISLSFSDKIKELNLPMSADRANSFISGRLKNIRYNPRGVILQAIIEAGPAVLGKPIPARIVSARLVETNDNSVVVHDFGPGPFSPQQHRQIAQGSGKPSGVVRDFESSKERGDYLLLYYLRQRSDYLSYDARALSLAKYFFPDEASNADEFKVKKNLPRWKDRIRQMTASSPQTLTFKRVRSFSVDKYNFSGQFYPLKNASMRSALKLPSSYLKSCNKCPNVIRLDRKVDIQKLSVPLDRAEQLKKKFNKKSRYHSESGFMEVIFTITGVIEDSFTARVESVRLYGNRSNKTKKLRSLVLTQDIRKLPLVAQLQAEEKARQENIIWFRNARRMAEKKRYEEVKLLEQEKKKRITEEKRKRRQAIEIAYSESKFTKRERECKTRSSYDSRLKCMAKFCKGYTPPSLKVKNKCAIIRNDYKSMFASRKKRRENSQENERANALCRSRYAGMPDVRKTTPGLKEAIERCASEKQPVERGPNVLGFRLGISASDAIANGKLVRELGSGRVGRTQAQDARPYNRAILAVSDNRNHGIALFFNGTGQGELLAGLSRRVYFGSERPTMEQVVTAMTEKYGPATAKRGNDTLLWSEGGNPGTCAPLADLVTERGGWQSKWQSGSLLKEHERDSQAKIDCLRQIDTKTRAILKSKGLKISDEETYWPEHSKESMKQLSLCSAPTASRITDRMPLMISAEGGPADYEKYASCGVSMIAVFNKGAGGTLSDLSVVLIDPARLARQPAFAFKEKSKTVGNTRIKF